MNDSQYLEVGEADWWLDCELVACHWSHNIPHLEFFQNTRFGLNSH